MKKAKQIREDLSFTEAYTLLLDRNDIKGLRDLCLLIPKDVIDEFLLNNKDLANRTLELLDE